MSTHSSPSRLIHQCITYLQTEYQYIYGSQHPDYAALIEPMASEILGLIASCDAPYHNLDHTVQVVLAGQEMAQGKYLCAEPVPVQDWLQFIIALLCHDIGYLKGVCRHDCPEEQVFATGVDGQVVRLQPEATGASLTPYHVDRGKLFVAETFRDQSLINIAAVQLNIELTRFPVPRTTLHADTRHWPGLTRAADLIGQLADPMYLSKLPALFQEFEETGSNKAMGYQSPQELRSGYPKFYWQGVSLYLTQGIRYLEMTHAGRAILANLYNNRAVVEKELDRFYYGYSNAASRLLRRWWRSLRHHSLATSLERPSTS